MRRPVFGDALHNACKESRIEPSDWKMRLMFAVWSANPIWIPKKPNEMFHKAEIDFHGFSLAAVAFIPSLEANTR
jgi:hypothetical protein